MKLENHNGWFITLNVVFVFIASIHYLCILDNSNADNACLSIYHILYIPMMIIFYYLFSTIINEKHILSFIFIIFIEIFLSLLFMVLAKTSNYWIIAFISILSGALSSILFYCFWFNNTKAFIWIIIFSILFGIYLTLVLAIIKRKDFEDKIYISVMALNYSFFGLAIFVVSYILYGLFKFLCFCIKECENCIANIN